MCLTISFFFPLNMAQLSHCCPAGIYQHKQLQIDANYAYTTAGEDHVIRLIADEQTWCQD